MKKILFSLIVLVAIATINTVCTHAEGDKVRGDEGLGIVNTDNKAHDPDGWSW